MVVSNTGPLTSAFQSDSMDLLASVFGVVHTTDACIAELTGQGWGDALAGHGPGIVSHQLTEPEAARAAALAGRIAAHPVSKEREPSHHLGEAEAIVLAQRPEFGETVLLLDELAARAVASEEGISISGFAGVLLLAVEEGLLSATQAKEKMVRCQQQGTHYSNAFIRRVFEAAVDVMGGG